jgi:prevent-host-death family protein
MLRDLLHSARMEEIAVSKFKPTCLAVMEQVRRTRKPVLVTRFGKPVVEIVPPTSGERPRDWIGSLKGTAETTGDIIAPAADEEDWDALR